LAFDDESGELSSDDFFNITFEWSCPVFWLISRTLIENEFESRWTCSSETYFFLPSLIERPIAEVEEEQFDEAEKE